LFIFIIISAINIPYEHTKHVYAQFVEQHPEWDQQTVNNELIQGYLKLDTWADVFRRIGLDERDHMNMSFRFCDKPECVVEYDGMPEYNRLESFRAF